MRSEESPVGTPPRRLLATPTTLPATETIAALESALKGQEGAPLITPPGWSEYVKTSPGNEQPPVNPDWWFTRSASILRKIFLRGVIGQRRLSREYRRTQNRGVRSNCTRKGSRKILRVILQQLEALGLVEQVSPIKSGVPRGRRLTSRGVSFINTVLKSAYE